MIDLSQYLPILLFILIAFGLSILFVVAPMAVSRLTGAHNPDAEKLSEYECGFPAFEDARSQFDVRFYLVAISFHRVRSRSRVPVPLGGQPRADGLGRFGAG